MQSLSFTNRLRVACDAGKGDPREYMMQPQVYRFLNKQQSDHYIVMADHGLLCLPTKVRNIDNSDTLNLNGSNPLKDPPIIKSESTTAATSAGLDKKELFGASKTKIKSAVLGPGPNPIISNPNPMKPQIQLPIKSDHSPHQVHFEDERTRPLPESLYPSLPAFDSAASSGANPMGNSESALLSRAMLRAGSSEDINIKEEPQTPKHNLVPKPVRISEPGIGAQSMNVGNSNENWSIPKHLL